jgi:transglutaminase-like putative cysteine protease
VRRSLVWLALDCLIVLSLVLPSCTPAMTPANEEKKEENVQLSEQEVVTPVPAGFIISSLSVTPSKVKPGEQVTISSVVTNTGGSEGSYIAIFKINEIEETRKEVSIGAGKSQAVEFAVVRNSEGSYKVSIDNKTGQFTVSAPAPVITPPPVVTPPPTPSLSLTDNKAILSNPVTYEVTRTLTIKNTAAQPNLVRVWLAWPAEWYSQTGVTSVSSTPNPTSTWKDSKLGDSGVFWEISNEPAAGSSFTITDKFEYTCSQISYDVDPEKIGNFDKSSTDYILFTSPEKYLEADYEPIKDTAAELTKDKSPYDAASSIYDWVVSNMSYQSVGGLKGAKFAFDNRYGECGDYSALFVALCRAAGIPARPVVGRWATSSPADWHVWAEFYVPSYGWVPTDLTSGQARGKYYFGNLDNNRLILHKGYNITVQPNPIFFDSVIDILQTYLWEWKGSGDKLSAELTYTINQK